MKLELHTTFFSEWIHASQAPTEVVERPRKEPTHPLADRVPLDWFCGGFNTTHLQPIAHRSMILGLRSVKRWKQLI